MVTNLISMLLPPDSRVEFPVFTAYNAVWTFTVRVAPNQLGCCISSSNLMFCISVFRPCEV